MKEALAKTLCAVHPERPATARCPSCHAFFCGECITEHHGKLVCASCLARAVNAERSEARSGRSRFRFHPAAWLQMALAIALSWAVWYAFAQFLGDIPDAFHDGTIWE